MEPGLARRTGRPRIRLDRSGPSGERIALTTVDSHGSGTCWSQQLELALGRNGSVEHVPVTLSGDTAVQLTRQQAAADFILPNGRGLGYGDFILDATSLDWLLTNLPDVPDALTRGSAWLTLWDRMLNAAVQPGTLLALAMRAIESEPSELNLQRLLACIERLVWTFSTDAERAEVAPALEASLARAPRQGRVGQRRSRLLRLPAVHRLDARDRGMAAAHLGW